MPAHTKKKSREQDGWKGPQRKGQDLPFKWVTGAPLLCSTTSWDVGKKVWDRSHTWGLWGLEMSIFRRSFFSLETAERGFFFLPVPNIPTAGAGAASQRFSRGFAFLQRMRLRLYFQVWVFKEVTSREGPGKEPHFIY